MPSKLKQWAIVFLLPLCAEALAGNDPDLQGCWRSQQTQVTLTDKSRRDQNADCVVEYDATHARSSCHSDTGDTETVSKYELVGPGRLQLTVLDLATGTPKGVPVEVRYQIEDDWLLIDRQFAVAPSASSVSKQPTNLKSVSVRVRTGDIHNSRCRPRGETGLRVGRSPRSSLALSVPPGWEPLLADPAADKRLAAAVDISLFVGAFVPRAPTTSDSVSGQSVLVLDDVRYGPTPIRSTEFSSVKKRFASELGSGKLTCDQPDRACASLRLPDGGHVYTELLNVNGRVAMVIASVGRATTDPTDLLRKSVQNFVEQLRSDNAK